MSGGWARGRRALAPLAALLVPLLPVAPADQARADGTGYRYWSFWEWSEEDARWTYAVQGPGTFRVHDGDVLGFRFAVSEEASDAHQPRDPATGDVGPAGGFDAVCGDEPAGDGARVAFVIDYGEAAHAPGGERPPTSRTACAATADGATAAEALAEVAEPLRYDANGLLCAIDGYPSRGCGEQVSLDEVTGADSSGDADEADASDADASNASDGGGSGVAVAMGVGMVALLAVAGTLRARARRRRA